MDESSINLKSISCSAIPRRIMKNDCYKLIKKHGQTVISFLVMHFIYLPLLSSCLLLNYMMINGFFSYDIISDNFFAINISTILLVALLGFLSLVMWSSLGYLILLKRGAIKKDKRSRNLLILLNFAFGGLLILRLFLGGDTLIIILSAAISLALMIFYCFYYTVNLKFRLIMIVALSGLTAFLIFVYGAYSAPIFGKALYLFGIGGGRQINIVYVDKSYEAHPGRLILLTPDFIYYVRDKSLVASPMSVIKTIDLNGK